MIVLVSFFAAFCVLMTIAYMIIFQTKFFWGLNSKRKEESPLEKEESEEDSIVPNLSIVTEGYADGHQVFLIRDEYRGWFCRDITSDYPLLGFKNTEIFYKALFVTEKADFRVKRFSTKAEAKDMCSKIWNRYLSQTVIRLDETPFDPDEKYD